MKTVKLYRFKIAGKPHDPLMLENIGEYTTRSDARKDMNGKRHSDNEYKYAIYDGNQFLSSTL